jgi:glycosyltransferase
MRISIITACHNSQDSIKATINSVLTQVYPDIEYIIVDGESDDRTVGIIKSFGAKISKWVSEPDLGLYDALNKGIEMATGDIIGFLHSDDFFIDDHVIEKVVHEFETKSTDAVYGDIQYVDQNDITKVLTDRKSGSYHRWKFKLGWLPPHPTFYTKRLYYEKYGLFDTGFSIAGDYDSMLRMLYRHKIRATYLPEVMVRMRVGGVSNRTMENIRRKWREDYRAMKKNNCGNLLTLFLKTMRPIAHFHKSPQYLFK